MIKQTLYPKTTRFTEDEVQITEKLDGSNLGIFTSYDILHIATRNRIYTEYEIEQIDYKGLKAWLNENLETLKASLIENTVIFGEWLGMGKLKYNFDNKFFIFATAEVEFSKYEEKLNISKMNYDLDLLKYAFVDEIIPDCMKIVPRVKYEDTVIETVEDLDKIYEKYVKEVGRDVEGFVVYRNGGIKKYVRHKNGKLTPHRTDVYSGRNKCEYKS